MRVWINSRRLLVSIPMLALLLFMAMPFVTFAKDTASRPTSGSSGFYKQTNLVSDTAGVAKFTDPHLLNPWGLVSSPGGPWWVSDNNGGVSTLYDGTGTIVPLVVNIPPPAGSPMGAVGTPTGTVYNNTSGFSVSENGKSGASLFIFATEDGTVSGWSPNVDGTNAILAVDRSKVGLGAVYKGLALGTNSNSTYLYATDFRLGAVEMFDSNFNLVKSFTDPNLPSGYAPFGIQNIGGNLYVTFALQDASKHDDVPGPGHGFVDVFDTSGNLVRTLISRGKLNSPWGLAMAPANFGQFSGDLLVGNFGNGHINVFNPSDGTIVGQLQNKGGSPIKIEDLWALEFGSGGSSGKTNQLFFTAGLHKEMHGLFGDIQFA